MVAPHPWPKLWSGHGGDKLIEFLGQIIEDRRLPGAGTMQAKGQAQMGMQQEPVAARLDDALKEAAGLLGQISRLATLLRRVRQTAAPCGLGGRKGDLIGMKAIEICKLGRVEPGHGVAPPAPSPPRDQSFAGQIGQRLAHRRVGEAQVPGQIIDDQGLAGQDLTAADTVANIRQGETERITATHSSDSDWSSVRVRITHPLDHSAQIRSKPRQITAECEYLRIHAQFCCRSVQHLYSRREIDPSFLIFQCPHPAAAGKNLPPDDHTHTLRVRPASTFCAIRRTKMAAPRSKNAILSETLKLVRQRRGLPASEVAQRMGLPLRTYHHFEGGRAQLDVDRIRRFAEATDSDPYAILTAVLSGVPVFAARTMDNKMMSVLIAGAQRFDERLGDDIAKIEVARFVTAARRMFDDLEADLTHRNAETRAWLAKPNTPDE